MLVLLLNYILAFIMLSCGQVIKDFQHFLQRGVWLGEVL